VRSFVVLGGDGTCSRVANAILKSGVDCLLTVVPTGTGNDFAKTLGVNESTPEEIVALLQRQSPGRIDVGRVDGDYFLNSCGFGFVASVLGATRHVRFLRGDAVYVYSALAQLFTYRGISVSGNSPSTSDTRKLLMLTVSNGRFLGGAFRIAPNASVVDGQLDFGFVGDSNVLDRVRLFAGAFHGKHLSHRSVRTESSQGMTLRFSDPPMMEVDGELKQGLASTVKIECIPRALNVIAAPGFPL
jgi:diacylglycerol kinase (ATP)